VSNSQQQTAHHVQQNDLHLLPASATGASGRGTRDGKFDAPDDELLKFRPPTVAPLALICTIQQQNKQ